MLLSGRDWREDDELSGDGPTDEDADDADDGYDGNGQADWWADDGKRNLTHAILLIRA
jgi:hypothetical protein